MVLNKLCLLIVIVCHTLYIKETTGKMITLKNEFTELYEINININ